MASDIIIQDKHREEGLNNRGVEGWGQGGRDSPTDWSDWKKPRAENECKPGDTPVACIYVLA